MRLASVARFAVALALAAAAPLSVAAAEPDLTTPRRALRRYIDAARAARWSDAAAVLDLRDLSAEERASDGPRLARELKVVIDQTLWIDWDGVSDAREGDPADGVGADVIGLLPAGDSSVPLRVVRDEAGAWRIGPGVTAALPRLYAAYRPISLLDRLPPVFVEVGFLEVQAWQWIGLAMAGALALLAAFGSAAVALRAGRTIAKRTRARWDDTLVESALGPTRMILGALAFAVLARPLHLAVPARALVDDLLRITSIAALSWAAVRAVALVANLAVERMSHGSSHDSAVRGRVTQILVLKRIAGAVIMVVGGALALLQFDSMRSLGTSVLASAGIAGIVVGLAAQRSIGTILAGVQISLTQPIRVGDVVVIEGEWGTIEEITLTYVVVKIWDLRRLVVPITRVLEAPFQNWTRTGTEILGTVFVRADYRVPVNIVRRELERFVETRPEWDRKIVGLQVTDASERAIELRALVSAADASSGWDLRCAVREHLVSFLQRLDGGSYLPRTRLEPTGSISEKNTFVNRGASVAQE